MYIQKYGFLKESSVDVFEKENKNNIIENKNKYKKKHFYVGNK